MEGGSPTLRRRRLGHALRRLRDKAGLTGDEAGARLERSGSWISRVEAGRVGLRTRDLTDLLDLYQLDDPQRREELAALAREGKQRGWWSRYSDAIHESLAIFIGLEAEAHSMLIYEQTVVPGLLQTEEYSRAIFRQSVHSIRPEVLEARVHVRMTRQNRIKEPDPLQLRVVLDEAVLHRAVGGRSTLRDQLIRLADTAASPWLELLIVPFDRSYQVATGSFIVMEFPQDPDIVYLETPMGGVYEEGRQETDLYRTIFEVLAAAALDRVASVAFLEDVIKKLA
ncbi:MAG TPA: helix-turn-helix transcriptional regulator [Micromonosporaceae bacterium]|nr:helix-turn-helix transcriptional regulator [Micromonosporaceae bacterium]